MKKIDITNCNLERFSGDFKYVINLGFGYYFGMNINEKVPKSFDLGEFLKTEGFELKLGVLKI